MDYSGLRVFPNRFNFPDSIMLFEIGEMERMVFLKQSLFRTVCDYFPFFPCYWPLLCMLHKVPWDITWNLQLHEKNDAGLVKHTSLMRRGNIWRGYPCPLSLSLPHHDPEHGFYTIAELEFRNDMFTSQFQMRSLQSAGLNIFPIWGRRSPSGMHGVAKHSWEKTRTEGIKS